MSRLCRWLLMGVWVLGCAVSARPASATPTLIGDTVLGCFFAFECVSNSFSPDTAVVVDPGIEFSGSTDAVFDIVSADFGGADGLTLTISWFWPGPSGIAYGGRGMLFDDIDWSGAGRITNVSLLAGNSLPIHNLRFEDHRIEFDFGMVFFPPGMVPDTQTAVLQIEGAAVPEPTSVLLLGLGLGVVVLQRRRAS